MTKKEALIIQEWLGEKGSTVKAELIKPKHEGEMELYLSKEVDGNIEYVVVGIPIIEMEELIFEEVSGTKH